MIDEDTCDYHILCCVCWGVAAWCRRDIWYVIVVVVKLAPGVVGLPLPVMVVVPCAGKILLVHAPFFVI